MSTSTTCQCGEALTVDPVSGFRMCDHCDGTHARPRQLGGCGSCQTLGKAAGIGPASDKA